VLAGGVEDIAGVVRHCLVDVVEAALHCGEAVAEGRQALLRLTQRVRVPVHADHAGVGKHGEEVLGVAAGAKRAVDKHRICAELLDAGREQFSHAVAHDGDVTVRVVSEREVRHAMPSVSL